MPLTIISRNQAKRDLIREVALAWIQVDPAGAREAAEQLKELQRCQYKRNGGYRKGAKDQYGYVKYRIPQPLFILLRRFMPDFLNDDKDIRLLCQEFPDLIPNNMDK